MSKINAIRVEREIDYVGFEIPRLREKGDVLINRRWLYKERVLVGSRSARKSGYKRSYNDTVCTNVA
jgi:hypothetical protein